MQVTSFRGVNYLITPMFSKKVKFLESQIPRRIKLVEMNIDTQVNRLQDFYSGGSRGEARPLPYFGLKKTESK